MDDGCMRVGIVGGGASGALVAARLLRDARGPVHVLVFEPREQLGRGVAYSTDDPVHLLNVPALGMSAFPEDPGHFVRWADSAPTAFLPRALYGDYLVDVLRSARDEAPAGSRLIHVRASVTDLAISPHPWLQTDDGEQWDVDAIVLATGHAAPAVPEPLRGLRPDRVIVDPWAANALDGVRPNERVLVIGTGLTFVDVAMSLLTRTAGVRVEAVSRHGLLPIAHEDPWRPGHEPPAWGAGSVDLRTIVGFVRGFGDDWRRGLDSLRSTTPALWQALDSAGKEAFVERLARFWDVHRHRMAPAVARALARLQSAGRVSIRSAEVVDAATRPDGRLAVRLSDETVSVVDRIILCTGPQAQAQADPLARTLVSHGTAVNGPFGMGYDVDAVSGAVVDVRGTADPRLIAIGPLRKGVLWESTAMPEIRVQAADVARSGLRLSEERHVPAK